MAAAAVLWTLPVPPDVVAQVRRCTTADGGTLFTDKPCSALDAVESMGHRGAGARAAGPRYRGGCARRLQDLIADVGSAIDARDTNRLASLYHWTGMSSRTGYAVIGRLDGIAQRPLVNITALRPEVPVFAESGAPGISARVPVVAATAAEATPAVEATATATEATAPTADSGGTATAPPPPPPPTVPRSRAPVALRIDQTLADGVTPSRTVFRLRRHMECWWISL